MSYDVHATILFLNIFVVKKKKSIKIGSKTTLIHFSKNKILFFNDFLDIIKFISTQFTYHIKMPTKITCVLNYFHKTNFLELIEY